MGPVARTIRVWAGRVSECRRPDLLLSALRFSRERRRLLSFATGEPADVIDGYIREIEDDREFLDPLRSSLARATSYTARAVDFMMTGASGSVFFNEVALYALVRARRPAMMIETGGTPGKSSAFILRAMMRSGTGHLHTIDLPPPASGAARIPRGQYHESRPAGLGANWIVDPALRARQTLHLGSSRDVLPGLLSSIGSLDIFLHDSDHSYENMTWEFERGLPALGPHGLLVSDDVLANTAFPDFCRREALVGASVFNLGIARRPQPRSHASGSAPQDSRRRS